MKLVLSFSCIKYCFDYVLAILNILWEQLSIGPGWTPEPFITGKKKKEN